MKTKENKKTRKIGKRTPSKTPARRRIRERALNEDEMKNITNVEVDEDIDRETQDYQARDNDRSDVTDIEGDEQRSSRKRRIEELNDDEAIF